MKQKRGEKMKFTAEELAEMAAADAEIEATFELTPQEAYDADRRDRQIQRSNLPPEKALQVEKERRYRRENREKFVLALPNIERKTPIIAELYRGRTIRPTRSAFPLGKKSGISGGSRPIARNNTQKRTPCY